MRLSYEAEVRTKNSEIQNHNKNGLKDSIRVALSEFASVHYKYGYVGQALSLWEKSFDMTSSDDD